MIALMLATILSIPYVQSPDLGDIAPPSDCAHYLGVACDNWRLATWLPELGPDLGIADHATPVTFTDGFIFDGHMPSGKSFAGAQGSPTTGTPFTYGKAGPPRGLAIYDSRRRLAFYGQGCCAWHSAVLAAGVKPPPVSVEDRSLARIRTERGLYLGMAMRQALQLYGNAPSVRLENVPGVTILSYSHKMPPPSTPCEQNMTLGFYHGQLIYIGFTNAC